MEAWLPKALVLAARTLVPRFVDTKHCGRALGALMGRCLSQVSLQEALSCVGLEVLSEAQRCSIEQAGHLFAKPAFLCYDRPQTGPRREETALMMCQLIANLLRQKAPGQLAALVAYAVPAFLLVTGKHNFSPTDSWQQHLQLLWPLFCDSAHMKGVLAYTAEDRLKEQADTAVAPCLLSICQEGQQSSSFQFSHGEAVL